MVSQRIQTGSYSIKQYTVIVRDAPSCMDYCNVCGGMYINVHILKDNDDMFRTRDICHKCTFEYKLDHRDLAKRTRGIALLKIKGII